MSLSDKIAINSHYTRSVNLERDQDSIELIKAYIPTSRARRTLERLVETFSGDTAPRAWSLVGPYGSGKSSFSVFLSQLISAPSLETTKTANKVLAGADRKLASQIAKHTKGREGYLKVLITGSPEPLTHRILEGLHNTAEEYWYGRRGKKPAIIGNLKAALDEESVSPTEVVRLIRAFQKAIEGHASGLILVIDELGKFLEYEARHYGANDIYLLQSIAEHACRGSKANLYLFVLLHQSFDQYAKGLGESLKREWSKVQGRFEEVPFLETAEQTLRVMTACFERSFSPSEQAAIEKNVKRIVGIMHEGEALPGAMTLSEAETLFIDCYPLHPLTAILLPNLCQRVAQNERTLFSYLGSGESSGFKDTIKSLGGANDFVMPHHVFDYFIANQPSVASDHITSKRWAEVVTAVDRLGDSTESERTMLKNIGLLNIIGSRGGLKAAKDILQTLTTSKAVCNKSLKALSEKSIINYRRFSNEFRVWQGSDFDIEDALEQELHNLGKFSLSAELNNKKSMLPVVARRYTVQNGTLRYFMPVFVDASNYKALEIDAELPRIIFYLATAQDDEKLFHSDVAKHFKSKDILALVFNAPRLEDAAAEVLALQRIHTSRHELQSDPIAKQEYYQRLSVAQRTETNLIQDIFERPEDSLWTSNGKSLLVESKRCLQVTLSAVLDKVYAKSPAIRNELVNRTKLSSQAAGGRNRVMARMLESEADADLGIEGFPPEKAIYRSVLLDTGMHVKDGKGWKLCPPSKKSTVWAVWQEIESFLESTEERPRTLNELGNVLTRPPFGVKEGLLPILYMAAIRVHQHEVALFENRLYTPEITIEQVERLVKRPDEFAVQRFRIDGMKSSIFEQYSDALFGDKKNKEKRSILDFAKPIASFIGNLPEYTKRTRAPELSAEAQRVRNAFQLAKSPENLLFEDLPNALGLNLTKANTASMEDVEGLSQKLTSVLRELKHCYRDFISAEQSLLADALLRKPKIELAELRKEVYGRFSGLENFTVDRDGLRALLMRLGSKKENDEQWLEKVLSFLGQKPTEKWSDADRSEARFRLHKYSTQIKDLRTLRLHEDKVSGVKGENLQVLLIKALRKGSSERSQVVAIDDVQLEAIKSVQIDLQKALKGVSDPELKLAAIAQLTEQFLEEYEKPVTLQVNLTKRGKENVK